MTLRERKLISFLKGTVYGANLSERDLLKKIHDPKIEGFDKLSMLEWEKMHGEKKFKKKAARLFNILKD